MTRRVRVSCATRELMKLQNETNNKKLSEAKKSPAFVRYCSLDVFTFYLPERC